MNITEQNKKQLISLAKQCLSIIDSSTLKDKEIEMIIDAAITDMKRLGIDVEKKIDDQLLIMTIMIYVKANFGDTEVSKKEMYLKRYKANLDEMFLSEEYRMKEEGESNA